MLAWPAAGVAAPKGDASPKDEQARQLYNEGLEASNEQDWDRAVDRFQASFEIEENPLSLFGLAQATRHTAGCRDAVPLYKRFMRMVPEGSQPYDYAREALVDCATEMAETEDDPDPDENVDVDPVTPPPDPEQDPIEDDPPRNKKDRPWHRDPLGGVLVGVGAATAAAGGTVMIVAEVQNNQQAENYGMLEDRLDRIKVMRIAGGVVLGVGGALLIGGVVRWAVLGAKQNRGRTAVVPAVGPGHAGFTLFRRF